MAFFEDFQSALERYPEFNVALSITNVAVETGTAGAININEKWKFRVKVENNGSLNMNNVMLHVSGDNGATVSTSAAGPFTGFPPIEVGPLTVAARGSQKSDFLFFQAPPGSQAPADLVKVHISDWDGDLGYLLETHANHSPLPSAAYNAEVFP